MKGPIMGDQLEEPFAPRQQVVNGVTAHAGGGQAAALLLIAAITRLTTVGSANDSVVLPPAGPYVGATLTVINAGANSANVFPNGTDQIDALGASAAKAVAAGKTCDFIAVAIGQWHALLSA